MTEETERFRQRKLAVETFYEIPENLEELERTIEGIQGKKTLNIYSKNPSPFASFLADRGAEVSAVNPTSVLKQEFGMPFSEHFDLVVCQHFLVSDLPYYFSEMHRILLPGGHYLSDEMGWEKDHLRTAGFEDFGLIAYKTFFHARKPK